MTVAFRNRPVDIDRTPRPIRIWGNFLNFQQTAEAPDIQAVIGDGSPTRITPGSTVYAPDGEELGDVWLSLPDDVELPAGQDSIRINLAYGRGDYRPPNWAADVRVENAHNADGSVVPVTVAIDGVDSANPLQVEIPETKQPLKIVIEGARSGQELAKALYVALGDQKNGQAEKDALFVTIAGRDGQLEDEALFVRLGGGRDGQETGAELLCRLEGGRDGQETGAELLCRLEGGRDGQALAEAIFTSLGPRSGQTALQSVFTQLSGGRDGQAEGDSLYARLGGGRDGQAEADSLYARLGGGRDGQAKGDAIYFAFADARDGQAVGTPLLAHLVQGALAVAYSNPLPVDTMGNYTAEVQTLNYNDWHELAANPARRFLKVRGLKSPTAGGPANGIDVQVRAGSNWYFLGALDIPPEDTDAIPLELDLSPWASLRMRFGNRQANKVAGIMISKTPGT